MTQLSRLRRQKWQFERLSSVTKTLQITVRTKLKLHLKHPFRGMPDNNEAQWWWMHYQCDKVALIISLLQLHCVAPRTTWCSLIMKCETNHGSVPKNASRKIVLANTSSPAGKFLHAGNEVWNHFYAIPCFFEVPSLCSPSLKLFKYVSESYSLLISTMSMISFYHTV